MVVDFACPTLDGRRLVHRHGPSSGVHKLCLWPSATLMDSTYRWTLSPKGCFLAGCCAIAKGDWRWRCPPILVRTPRTNGHPLHIKCGPSADVWGFPRRKLLGTTQICRSEARGRGIPETFLSYYVHKSKGSTSLLLVEQSSLTRTDIATFMMIEIVGGVRGAEGERDSTQCPTLEPRMGYL